MSFADVEGSRSQGQPVNLYLFKGSDPSLESLVRAMTVIPASTEFGYGTTPVSRSGIGLNTVAGQPTTDFIAAMDDLAACAPNIEEVSLVVSWHGTDLRAGVCDIIPKVESSVGGETPYAWNVGGLTRESATVVSQISGKPAIGGAPSDRSIYEAIVHLKARGWRVNLYPFIQMDIAAGNALTNPYDGSGSQPAYPWRGRITITPAIGEAGTVDKTQEAFDQIVQFFGAAEPEDYGWDDTNKHVTYSGPVDWGYRHFILHMAQIAKVANADRLLIGSELVAITNARGQDNRFPGVECLQELVKSVRILVGEDILLGYGADWSEYHSYQPADGSGDIYFNLDALYAEPAIDFIGIDNYLPTSDWRDGSAHLDLLAGYPTIYDQRYLQANIEGGEYYDWYYSNSTNRGTQTRTPIVDEANGEDWVFRQKDIRNWWLNAHHNRPAGVRSGSATAWTPQSKPIVFTELGVPAVNKGSNQPNVFVDSKSSESAYPYYSNTQRDDAIQRLALESILGYWSPDLGDRNPISTVYGEPMIDFNAITLWTWDARPYPTFPNRSDVWGDVANWTLGHWLNGRLEPGKGFNSGTLGPFCYTDAEQQITRDGLVYLPVPITRGAITSSGSLDKSTLEVRSQQDLPAAELFKAYPPASVLNLFVIAGHANLDPDVDFVVAWTGRVLSCAKQGSEAVFTCEPVATSMKRNGLRRNYQIGCPHVLYGSACRANRQRVQSEVEVTSLSGNTIELPTGWNTAGATSKYLGGMVEWTKPDGSKQVRTIRRINSGVYLVVGGDTSGLTAGDTLTILPGCNQQMDDCAELHDNIWNFGGFPYIPKSNPLAFVNIFG